MTGEIPCAERHKSPPALSTTTSACTSFLTIGHTYSDEKPQKVDETYHTRHCTICDKDIPEQHNFDDGDCECGAEKPTNYGSEEAPLSVTQALALAAKECESDGNYTKQIVIATGILTNQPTDKSTYWQDITLRDVNDESKTIAIYTINKNAVVGDPYQNDVITIKGYIKNYHDAFQFSSNNGAYVEIVRNERGMSRIEEGDHEGAAISGLTNQAKVQNGEIITFTVEPLEGKKIIDVKVNGISILSSLKDTNQYSFTVQGDAIVTVETADEGTEEELVTATIEITAEKLGLAGYSDDSKTIDNVTFSWKQLMSTTDSSIQFKKNGDGLINNTTAFSGAITKIELVRSTALTGTGFTLKIGSNNDYNDESVSINFNSNNTLVYEFDASKDYRYFYIATSGSAAALKSITVTYLSQGSGGSGGETGGDSGSGGGEEAGDDTAILQYTLQFGSGYNDKSVQNYSSSWTVTSDNLTWTMVNFNNNNNGWNYVKGGKASSITSQMLPKKITKIIIYITEKDTAKNVTLDISSSSSFDSIAETQTVSTAVGEVEITIDNPNINYYYRLSFDGTANKSITIEKVEFYGI